jgi:hypothetical protein
MKSYYLSNESGDKLYHVTISNFGHVFKKYRRRLLSSEEVSHIPINKVRISKSIKVTIRNIKLKMIIDGD